MITEFFNNSDEFLTELHRRYINIDVGQLLYHISGNEQIYVVSITSENQQVINDISLDVFKGKCKLIKIHRSGEIHHSVSGRVKLKPIDLTLTEEYFKEQLEINQPLTNEQVLKMKVKTYHNGTPIKPGDIMLYILIHDTTVNDNLGQTSLALNIISKEHIGLYDIDTNFGTHARRSPIAKLK
jgi:hypothetical protein